MKQQLLNKLPKKKTTFSQKKKTYLDIQIKKAAQENKRLLNLAREYITQSELDFESANPIQALCNYHNTPPMALRHLGRNSAEYLVRVLNKETQDIKNIKIPDYIGYRRLDLEKTISSFKLLKLASELEELMGDKTRQDFYNQAKITGLISNSENKELFYDIADNLTGNGRYFGHSYIDENQDLTPLSEILSNYK